MDIKGKNNLILAKIFSNKNIKILSVFLVVFLFSFVFVNDANALLGGLERLLFNVISAFFESLAYIAVMISKVFMIIFSSVIQGTGSFANSPAVDIVWTFVRDLVNMSFIIAMLIAAVYKMIGKENSLKAKKFSTQIIYILIGAFIINFSKVILGAFIDITNLISMIFVNSYKDSINNVFNNFFYFETTVAGAYRNMLESILLFVFGLGLFAYCATLLLYGVVRMGILTICTMLSPLLIFSFFFPTKIDFIDKLNIKKQFFSFSFGGITVTFFLWICLMILSAGGTSQLDNAIFSTSDAETIKGTVTEDVAGNASPSSDFWEGALLKIVAVAILLLGQKTAMDMAKEAGFGAEKLIGKVANSVNTFGMAPLNFAKSSLLNTVDYGKFLGLKAKDSAVGGISGYLANNRDNFFSKAISAADKLRISSETRNKSLSERQKIRKEATDMEGIKALREYNQNQSKKTTQQIGEHIVGATAGYRTVRKGVSNLMDKAVSVQEFKNKRDSFITDKVMDSLKNIKQDDFSTNNANMNLVNALLSAEFTDDNNNLVSVLTNDQKNKLNNIKDPIQKANMAKQIYDGMDPNRQGAVAGVLNNNYNASKSKLQNIETMRASGDIEGSNKAAMELYNSGAFGINKSKIDEEYNSEIEKLRGNKPEKEKLSKEERRIQSFERQKEIIKRNIKLGVGTYTEKDIDVLDAKIEKQKKQLLEKAADKELRERVETLKRKKSMSEEQIDSLISRDKQFKELGGDEMLSLLKNDERLFVADSDYLDNANNTSLIQEILSSNNKEELMAKVQKAIEDKKMTQNMANWIVNEKDKDSSVDINKLREIKKQELSEARAKTLNMESLKLNNEEKDIVDISYKKIQGSRQDLVDAHNVAERQEENINISRQKAAGVFKNDKSERWTSIKNIQTRLKDSYVNKNGEFDKNSLDLTSFFSAESLRNGKFTLSGSKDDFVAALALKISSGGKLTPLEERILSDEGVSKMVMEYVNNGNDNILREEWNKQIEKSKNSGFVSRFRTKIIEPKPTIKTFDERKAQEEESYSADSIKNRVIEYLSSTNIRNYIDKKTGALREDKLQSDLEKKYGVLDFSNSELLQDLFQQAASNSADVGTIKNYSTNSDIFDIAESIENVKEMYKISRRPEYLAMAAANGIKNKDAIEKYIERMAYKDVMDTFNPSAIENKNAGIGQLISQEMDKYGYDTNNKDALLDMFMKVSKTSYGGPIYKYNDAREIGTELSGLAASITQKPGLTQQDRSLIEGEFNKIKSSVLDLQESLSSNNDLKKMTESVSLIQNSIEALKANSFSGSNVINSSVIKSLEDRLANIKFTLDLSDKTSKLQTSAGNDPQKLFELNNKAVGQLRRLLDSVNNSKVDQNNTIEAKIRAFGDGIKNNDKSFIDFVSRISKNIGKGSEDQNIAYRQIIETAMENTSDIEILKELLRNIDKKQIELINKINTRIKNLDNFNKTFDGKKP